MIGQSGVERRYDAFLRGIDGIDAVTVDAFGQPTGAVRHLKAPVPGRNVRLTIDLDTQRAAEQALAYGVRSNASEGANAGALVALDPENGEVRALASFPTFDPNWFISYRKPKFQAQLEAHHAQRRRARELPAARPRHRRALPRGLGVQAVRRDRRRQGAAHHAEPAAAMHAVRRYYGKRFNNWDKTFDGRIDLIDALERSCDTYFYQLGDMIFREGGKQGHPLQDWAAKFGFGSRTGIDIVGEDEGLLPDAGLEDGLLQGELLRSEQAVATTRTGCSTRAGTRPTRSTSRSGRATSTSRRCSSPSATGRSRTAAPS